jgi:transcriptional regulator with XRE-family HTH domain
MDYFMSSMDLSNYLRQRMLLLGLSNTKVASRANISRPTWYRVVNGDITEAKISTLVGIAKAFDLHLYQLLAIRFGKRQVQPHYSVTSYASGFINDVSYPRNSVVAQNETFTKQWKVANLGCYDWEGMVLQCVSRSGVNSSTVCQQPRYESTVIPNTKTGETIDISVNIIAPSYPCTIVSEWEIVDKNHGVLADAQFAALNCVVRVV